MLFKSSLRRACSVHMLIQANRQIIKFLQERLANLVIEDDSPLDQSLNDSPPAKRSRSQNQDTPKVNSSVPVSCQKGRGFGSGRIRSFLLDPDSEVFPLLICVRLQPAILFLIKHTGTGKSYAMANE
jgi:hypothetical protein